jgi:ubiquinone/menaquinone biosynthesis C-methylase UbiE
VWRDRSGRLWWSFLGLFFRLLYHECAWTYGIVAWAVSWGQWQAWGRAALRHVTGTRVLELAHGPGHLLLTMARCGLHPVGLDLSPQMGRLAQGRLRRAGAAVPLVRARGEALPFRSCSFDSVVSTFPTEFIVAPATLREAARVLCSQSASGPAGRLVVAASVRLDRRHPLWGPLAWLYRITGQAQEGSFPLGVQARTEAERWFSLRQTNERVGRTGVVLFVADKA